MRLSPHEQQILDEIQRWVQAEDPTFFASMAGSQVRRHQSVWGSVTFLLGVAAFLFGAVMAQALPGSGSGDEHCHSPDKRAWPTTFNSVAGTVEIRSLRNRN